MRRLAVSMYRMRVSEALGGCERSVYSFHRWARGVFNRKEPFASADRPS